jgi:hypothetical protein
VPPNSEASPTSVTGWRTPEIRCRVANGRIFSGREWPDWHDLLNSSA